MKDANELDGLFGVDEKTLVTEASRALRRLNETGAILAVAEGLEKAVVVRDGPDGSQTKTAVIDTVIAQAMVLKEWISCPEPGRISRYRITAEGRSFLAGVRDGAAQGQGMAEAPVQFTHASPVEDDQDARRRRNRYGPIESPLMGLARRKDKTGKPFLSDELVAAGERLREDFELSQLGPRVTQNWESFLTGSLDGTKPSRAGAGSGPSAARARVQDALEELGPGLGDMALRCCCHLEGLEAAEKKMGWSARSGKIVLRIALQRLVRHYNVNGRQNVMIG